MGLLIEKIRQMQFVVCFIVFSIFLSFPAFAAGFEYRVPIGIENSGEELLDYQVKVVLDTEKLLAEDKISPSCADVRFTDSGSFDNSSWVKTYPFWVDYLSCGTKETVFWVKLDKIPAGKKVIYAYYGAEKPEFGSNGKGMFDFYQDFEDESVDYNNRQPAGWVESRYADVSVTDLEAFRGEKSMEIEGNSEADWSAYRLLPEQRESFVLEFEALPAQEGGALTVGTQSSWSLLQFGRCGANEIPAGHWGYSAHWFDGSWKMNWNDGGSYEKGKWYEVSLRFDGKNLEMDLNGEKVLEKTEVSPGGLSDRITVAGDSDCSVGWGVGGYIDTIRVRKYSQQEPSVKAGGEEQALTAEPYSALMRDWYSPANYKYDYFLSYPYSSDRISENQIIGKNYYSKSRYIFYYALVFPNGTEQVLKQVEWNSGTVTGSESFTDPYYFPHERYHYYSAVDLQKQYFSAPDLSGQYKLELRQIEIPAILVYKNPKEKYGLQDVLKYWNVESKQHYRYWFNQGSGNYQEYIDTLCAKEIQPGSLEFRQIEFRRNGNDITGSDNCGSVNMYTADNWCNYGWYESHENYPSPASRTVSSKSYCWFELDGFKTVKVSELPKKTVWIKEFEVASVEPVVAYPFSQNLGSGGDENAGDNSSLSLAGFAAVAAGAAGLALLGRKNVLKNIKSGLTQYGYSLKKRTKDILSFIQEEKNGYWKKEFERENLERIRLSKKWIEENPELFREQINAEPERAVTKFKTEDKKANKPQIPAAVKPVAPVFVGAKNFTAEKPKGPTGLFNMAKKGLGEIASSVGKAARGAADFIGGLFGSVVNSVKKVGKAVFDSVVKAPVIGKPVKAAVAAAKIVVSGIMDLGGKVIDKAKDSVGWVVNAVSDIVKSAADSVKDIVKPVLSSLTAAVKNSASAVISPAWLMSTRKERVFSLEGTNDSGIFEGDVERGGVKSRIDSGSRLLTETKQNFAELWESKAGYRERKRAYEEKIREGRNRELWIQKVKDSMHGEVRENVIELIKSGYIEAEELSNVVPALIASWVGNAKVLGGAVLDFVGKVPLIGKPIVDSINNIRDFIVEQSEQIKKSSDAIGLIGIGLIIGGIVLSATGVGAPVGITMLGIGLGAISGAMDITVWGAKESAGKANEDDGFRAAIAPLSFIGAGVGGKGGKELLKAGSQLSKQLQKEAGQVGILKEYKNYAQILFDKKGKSVPFYNWAGERLVYAGRKFLKGPVAQTLSDGKIYIDRGVPKGLEVPALLHEIIHAEIVKGKGFLKDLMINGDEYLKSGKKLLEDKVEGFKTGHSDFGNLVHDVFVDKLALKIDPKGTAKLLEYRVKDLLSKSEDAVLMHISQAYYNSKYLLKNSILEKTVLKLIENQPAWAQKDIWNLYGNFVKIGKLADISVFTKLEADLAKITVNQGGLITSIYELIKKDYGTMDNIIDKGREFDIVGDSGKKVRNGFK